MKDEIPEFIFLEHPASFTPQEGDTVAIIPAGVTNTRELGQHLKQQLALPPYFQQSFVILYQELHWRLRQEGGSRLVLLHLELPQLADEPLQGYLEVLYDCAKEKHPERQVLFLFPIVARQRIYDLLYMPAPWEVRLGFYDGPVITRARMPTWEKIQQALERIDGITIEQVIVGTKELGWLEITQCRDLGYRLYYTPEERYDHPGIDWNQWQQDGCRGSFQATLTSDHPRAQLVPLSVVIHSASFFFATGRVPSDIEWIFVTSYSASEDERLFCYWSDEEYARDRLIEGVRHLLIREMACQDGVPDLSSLEDRLQEPKEEPQFLALCAVGKRALPSARALLVPFLSSPHWQDRWVSARFLGVMKEERSYPVLIQMLTERLEEMPTGDTKQWMERWRLYVPQLLRAWPDEMVVAPLQQALRSFLQITSDMSEEDMQDSQWYAYEQKIGYELGWRKQWKSLDQISFPSLQRKHLLMVDLLKGALIEQESKQDPPKEIELRRAFQGSHEGKQRLISALTSIWGWTAQQAEEIWEVYDEDRMDYWPVLRLSSELPPPTW